jgi:hypothetical protein
VKESPLARSCPTAGCFETPAGPLARVAGCRFRQLVDLDPLRLRPAVDRFVPPRFEDDDVFFRAGDFFALFLVDDPWALVVLGADFFAIPFFAEVFLRADFLAGDFREEDFLADDFLADAFVADDFLAGDFREEDFLADDLLAGAFLADDFSAAFFFFSRCRATAAPPYVSAAALVPAITGTGCSATASTTFFPAEPTFSDPTPTADDAAFMPAEPAFVASEPTFWEPEATADAASPAFSFTVVATDGATSFVSSIASAAFSFSAWALSCATSCTFSAIVARTAWPVSLASACLPASVIDSVSFFRSGICDPLLSSACFPERRGPSISPSR